MTDAQWQHGARIAVEVLAGTTAFAKSAKLALPALKDWAASTADERNDELVTKLEVFINVVIMVCDVLRRIPHVTVGPLPSTQPIARSLPPPPKAPEP